MKTKISLFLVLIVSLVMSFHVYAEEAKVTGNASVGVFNRYVFRGYELSF